MPAPTADLLGETLAPLIEAPDQAAILCDVDGTLAPIVRHAEEARVPQETSRLLADLGGRYRCVACISGRSAGEARRLVGVGSVAYAGMHGGELLLRGHPRPELAPELAGWEERVRGFAAEHLPADAHAIGIRLEDKGPIAAFHWRGAPDEAAARRRLDALADAASASGFAAQWGRKVLEIRPPVEIHKGRAVEELVRVSGARRALFAGDDTTDLDAFAELTRLRDDGVLDLAITVGVRSDEGPPAITERADLTVDGPGGFVTVLAALAA